MVNKRVKRVALSVVVAVFLSFGVATFYPIYRNARVLTRIKELDGDFYSQHKRSVERLPVKWRFKLKELGREHYRGRDQYYQWAARFKNYTKLFLRGTNTTDDDLQFLLRGQGHILLLNLENTQITGEGLAHLKHCRHSLESLILNGTRVDSDSMEHLGIAVKLEYLQLVETAVDESAIQHLVKLKSLKRLSLPKEGFSDEAIEKLETALPNCRVSVTKFYQR